MEAWFLNKVNRAFFFLMQVEGMLQNLWHYLVSFRMDEFAIIRNYVSRFITFTEEEWRVHQSMLVRRFLKKGEFILRGGEVCNHVTFLNKGFVRVYNVVNDEELTANFAFEGNYVTDYTSFVSRQPSLDNIVAMEDLEILQLNYNDMQAAYEKYPVWQKFGRLIAEYILIFATERSRTFLFLSPEERYLKLIKDRPKVIANVPLKYIASYLGITPEALSRIRKRMAEG
jgi:CRP/FNR family transcriptional regulator, anaerobic regulatory protein